MNFLKFLWYFDMLDGEWSQYSIGELIYEYSIV